ncbi:HAD superfamily protein [Arthrobacter sp. PAMC 25486]|uniref:HAD family hydrolase n=1 Tax=Arthrobacter sp. PAMC 25486 TaxID=1494608 RepID=UPI0005362228|nr:HAD family hydrolase [Arthrobacter sp. PAMC 25486]AIY00912.1 HAD superfamily protein [Arthrobacter sp. PAMC 25486]
MTEFASQNTLESAAFAGRIKGVLLDIDETIVDLYRAMADAMIVASSHLLPSYGAADWSRFAALYMADAEDFYDRYVAGEFTFHEQRGLRARAVFARLGVSGFDAATEAQWIADFEKAQPLSIHAFSDVGPLLDRLDASGIVFGAVSNNVHDYQRAKLDQAGLSRIEVLVGIDTVGVAKPSPEIFLEGCRLIGTLPSETLYVGDNFMVDGVGSVSAGLHGVWLNRDGKEVPASDSAAAALVAEVASLAEIPVLLGLSEAASRV